jgi:CelD/BcsL family acetyltransferase involved in cellulose biosynthesis
MTSNIHRNSILDPEFDDAKIIVHKMEFTHFASISDKWNAFIQASTNDNIFLTYEWIISWWESFKTNDGDFYFLVACDSRQTILGALPLQIVRRRVGRLLRLKLLYFIGRGADRETEYNTFMMPPTLPGITANVYAAFVRYLYAHADDWDLGIITNLLSSHESTPVLEEEIKKKFRVIRIKQENNYVIALAQTYDGFLKGLSSKQRYNFVGPLKRVQKDWNASFSIITKPHEIESYLEKYYRLVRQRHGNVPSKPKKEFMASLCCLLAGAGRLRCYLLSLNDIPAATIFGFRYNKKYYGYKSAYNPDFFTLSPGNALFAFVIREEIENGSKEYDYLIGQYAYKQYWSNEVRTLDYLQIFPKGIKARLKVFLALGWMDIRRRLSSSLRHKRTRQPDEGMTGSKLDSP